MIAPCVLLLLSLLSSAQLSAGARTAAAKRQPVFILRDQLDGKCLGGSSFGRCGAATLLYVTGQSGQYLLHLKSADSSSSSADAEAGGTCIDKADCEGERSALKVSPCAKACANEWNILGDETQVRFSQGFSSSSVPVERTMCVAAIAVSP